MKNSPNGFVSMAIGLVLVLIGASLWEYSTFTLSKKIQAGGLLSSREYQNVPTPISTNGWKTYQDNQYGFSLQYPNDFSLKEEPGQSVTLVVPVENYFKTKLTGEATLTIYNVGKSCPAISGENQHPTSKSNLSSAAGNFTRVAWSDVGAGQLYESAHYSLIKNSLCYSALLLIHSSNGAGVYYSDPEKIAEVEKQQADDKVAFIQVIDRIISTFKFVK